MCVYNVYAINNVLLFTHFMNCKIYCKMTMCHYVHYVTQLTCILDDVGLIGKGFAICCCTRLCTHLMTIKLL